ncbi:TadE/TadG family type IV pilus assembly protein [Streptomyces sp. V3I7]|uniref:TadE/TadG family type IV pilus assembly protein n=1 Tax=Streptomyces sp. V3I7 TaxID=3042278 RepID=UPI00277F9D9A|nr:TadE/TadG family type IV pilus assembly protein [Streptomyces sp. V3I7]MDQ0992790.1 hypothetical protein [Streptomyces sp. V3I7]
MPYGRERKAYGRKRKRYERGRKAYGRGRKAYGRGRRSRADAGQVAIEYLGFVPILILLALAGVQIGLIAYAGQQAGTAARAGARAASLGDSSETACGQAVSGWLAGGTGCPSAYSGKEVTVTATVAIPSVVPGWDFGGARKSATMPLDH